MVSRPLFIFLIAILVTGGGIASSMQIPYPVYGYIKDNAGNPVAGVTVTVKEMNTGQIKVDVTDKLGRYSVTMDNYQNGDSIQITAGSSIATRTIDVQSGGIKVDLSAAPPAKNSNWMDEQTIFGLPNWGLIVGAISSGTVGLIARLFKQRNTRATDKTIEFIRQNI